MSFNFVKFDFIDGFIKANSKYRLVLSGLLSPIDLFLIKSIVSKGKKREKLFFPPSGYPRF